MCHFMIIVFSGCILVSALVGAHAFCSGYRSVSTCLALNVEVESAAEISSGPESASWFSLRPIFCNWCN